MRRVLVVYLKDTFYAGLPGAAQWHYTQDDAGQLEVVLLGSGSLAVFMPDEENGKPNKHLGGMRTQDIAFFPTGGWSGYCWEPVDESALAMASAQKSGIAVAR